MGNKFKRVLQVIFGFIFGMMAITALTAAIVGGKPLFTTILLALGPLLVGLIPIGILEYQIRLVRRAGLAIRANVEACAKAVFDAPGAVRPGYDMGVTSGPNSLLARTGDGDEGAAFTTDGSYNGTRVAVASHASTIGRQFAEIYHTYSYVVVDVLGLDRPFSLSRERASNRIGRALGAVTDVTIGDKAFDDAFMISTDVDFARAVLDESIRERIRELQERVSGVSQDLGAVGGMNILLSRKGLALRWPGDITPEHATFIRDLLLDMRERMLAFQNKKAAQVGAAATSDGVGYRVATDTTLEEPEDEVARAAARS